MIDDDHDSGDNDDCEDTIDSHESVTPVCGLTDRKCFTRFYSRVAGESDYIMAGPSPEQLPLVATVPNDLVSCKGCGTEFESVHSLRRSM